PVPSTATGSTVNATPDSEVYDCGVAISRGVWAESQENGVWYQVLGTGRSITVNTCAATTTFDTRIRVYCGACGQLSCIGGNDTAWPGCPAPSTAASVTWCSTAGTTYFIYVSGATNTTGSFTLNVLDSSVPCTSALPCGPCTLAPETAATLEPEPCGVDTDGG